MSKFCGNCGAKMEGSAVVCGNCGCSMDNNQTTFIPSNPEHIKAKKRKIKKIIGIFSVVLLVVLIIVLCFTFLGGRSEKDVVETYVKSGFENPDAASIIELFPEEFVTYQLRKEEMSRTEAIKEMQETIDDTYDKIDKYCDAWSITWEITNTIDAFDSEVKYLSADCKTFYDFEVSDQKDLTVEMTIEFINDGETDSRDIECDLQIIKVGKSWYLWEINGSSMNSYL